MNRRQKRERLTAALKRRVDKLIERTNKAKRPGGKPADIEYRARR